MNSVANDQNLITYNFDVPEWPRVTWFADIVCKRRSDKLWGTPDSVKPFIYPKDGNIKTVFDPYAFISLRYALVIYHE